MYLAFSKEIIKSFFCLFVYICPIHFHFSLIQPKFNNSLSFIGRNDKLEPLRKNKRTYISQ